MFELFKYSFIVRGFEAGLIIGLVAPLIGIFLVLRRYSLIADTLSHVSLAGVAIGLILKINPLFTAIGAAVLSSVIIERLRISKKIFGESALALFLSGSLALAVVLISFANGFNVDLFNYLFGSISTVAASDIYVILALSIVVVITVFLFFKELVFITFDEDAAQVAGIPTKFINLLLIMLAALTVAISIPIVGVLLIAALIVVPVICALQFKTNFKNTILIAESYSIIPVLLGMYASYYLNLPAGGAIVLLTIVGFILTLFLKQKSS